MIFWNSQNIFIESGVHIQHFMNDLSKGDIVQSSDIRAIRPGFGLSPKNFDTVVGKAVCCDVERGDPVTFKVIET